MHSKRGDRLFKAVTVKVFPPNAAEPLKRTVRAPAGKGFNAASIDAFIEREASDIEKNFPNWEFRLAQIAPNAFNFICAGLKEASA